MASAVRCPACGHQLFTLDDPPIDYPGDGAPKGRTDAPMLVRMGEAAQLLGVSRSTMYQLVAKGEVRVIRLGRTVRVARTELERIANQGR